MYVPSLSPSGLPRLPRQVPIYLPNFFPARGCGQELSHHTSFSSCPSCELLSFSESYQKMSQSSSQASLVQDQASLQLLGARLSPGKQTCPAPALPEDNEANDEAVIQQIERTVKTAETVLTSNSKRRIALVAVSIAGSALDQAASSDSSADAAGTSNASEEASKHLDTILQARDCK